MTKLQRNVLIVTLLCISGVMALSCGKWGWSPAHEYQKVIGIAIGSESSVTVTERRGPGAPITRQRTIPPRFVDLQVRLRGQTTTADRVSTAFGAFLIPAISITLAVYIFLGGRQRDRIARGLCGFCSYDRSASAADQRCPECGRFRI